MWGRTFRWLPLGALVAFVLLSGGNWLSYRSVEDLVQATEWRGRTLRVIAQQEELRGLLIDAERARRAYSLTRSRRTLGPCRKAVEQVGPRLEALAEVIDDEDERRQLERLRAVIERPISRFQKALASELPTSPGEETKLVPVVEDEFQAMNSLLDEMARAEHDRLERRARRAKESARFTTALTLGVNVFSVAFLGAVVALLLREVRARAGAEASVRRARDELAARVEERTADLREKVSMLDMARDAILVCDLQGRIRYWGPGAERLYGWRTDEAIGQPAPRLLFRGPSEELGEARRAVVERGEWRGELHEVNRDGQPVVVESHWGLVRDEAGQPRAIVASNIDITEKKRQEQRSLLGQRLESIGTLAGGIAHDLNNILTPILMTIKLLRKDRPNLDKARLLQTAEVSVERGAEMVRQLLSFAGRSQGQKGPVQVEPLVEEVASLLQHALPKTVRVRTQLPPGLWAVEGDATQLSQVLMNLSINARDAMPEGGELCLEAVNREMTEAAPLSWPGGHAGRYVLLSVTDTGVGIPPEVMGRIFDPFFTTKPVGKGSGLGLSTALGIVRAHGGHLQVYSEPGQGTRVSVYLPALADPATPPPPESLSLARAGRGELVLVIDDEESILTTARAALEGGGYRATSAASGAEGLALFDRIRDEVAAVVLDMMMPGMDGLSVLRELRRRAPGLRVVAASGLGVTERVQAAREAGACGFLHKPFGDALLLRAVGEAIQTQSPGREEPPYEPPPIGDRP